MSIAASPRLTWEYPNPRRKSPPTKPKQVRPQASKRVPHVNRSLTAIDLGIPLTPQVKSPRPNPNKSVPRQASGCPMSIAASPRLTWEYPNPRRKSPPTKSKQVRPQASKRVPQASGCPMSIAASPRLTWEYSFPSKSLIPPEATQSPPRLAHPKDLRSALAVAALNFRPSTRHARLIRSFDHFHNQRPPTKVSWRTTI